MVAPRPLGCDQESLAAVYCSAWQVVGAQKVLAFHVVEIIILNQGTENPWRNQLPEKTNCGVTSPGGQEGRAQVAGERTENRALCAGEESSTDQLRSSAGEQGPQSTELGGFWN